MGTRLVNCISWTWTQAVQLQSPYTQNIMSSVSCQEEYLLSCDYVLRELFYLDQSFLMGKSCPQGHIWQCLETFLVVTTWGQEDDWCLVDRDQGRCKTSCNIQNNAYNEDLPDPNVSSTEVEKPWHEATRGRSIRWTRLHLNGTKLRLTEMRYGPQVDRVMTERGPEPETSDFAVQGPPPPTPQCCSAGRLHSCPCASFFHPDFILETTFTENLKAQHNEYCYIFHLDPSYSMSPSLFHLALPPPQFFLSVRCLVPSKSSVND